ncbi:hypothetical protein Xekk_03826 [Xenorhabdus sp. KK7.4]|nr:hypothetical protein Xekk_03826 [Xenorhabdus sp. KK7.4]
MRHKKDADALRLSTTDEIITDALRLLVMIPSVVQF